MAHRVDGELSTTSSRETVQARSAGRSTQHRWISSSQVPGHCDHDSRVSPATYGRGQHWS